MPTAPSNPRYAAEEEDDSELTPLPPPEDRVADTPRYTPAQAQPAAAQPALGTTGGIIPTHGYAPGEDTSRPKGAPPDYSPDLAQRRTQINAEIDRRKRAAFDTSRPFAPSADYRGPSQYEYQQLGRQEETSYQQQALQARRTEVATRRAAIDTAKSEQMARNATRQQDFLASGQKHYRDPYGEIQPILEAGTNRPLYHPSQWEDGGMHPDTGEPTLVKRDQYGQRQYKTPPITANAADPADSNLYYDFGNGDLRPAGDITSLMTHPNPRVARLAQVANHKRNEAMRKEGLEAMTALAQAHSADYDTAKLRSDELTGQVEQLLIQQAAAPTPEGQKQLEGLSAEQEFLNEQLKPQGELSRLKRKAGLELRMETARLKNAQYTDSVELRRQILRDTGQSEENDPTLKEYIRARDAFGVAMSHAQSDITRDAVENRKMAAAYTPQTEAAPSGESTQAPFRGAVEGGAGAVGDIAKGLVQLQRALPISTVYNPDPQAQRHVAEALAARAAQTPRERLQATQNDPLYKWGAQLQVDAREAMKITPKEREGWLTKIGESVGGFVPLVATGPLAPATMALQTAGGELEKIYADRVAKGATPEAAAQFAIQRSLVSGTVQAALFEVLPKPLQALGSKAIETVAKSALGRILAGRVAGATESATLFGGSAAASNVVAERPVGEGVPQAAATGALFGAALPGPRGYKPKPGAPTAPAIGPGGEPKPPGTEPVAGQPTELPPISPNENQPTGTPAGGSQPPLQPNELAGGGPPAKPSTRGANANPDGPGEVLNQSGVAGGAGVAESPSGTATLGSQPVKLQVRRAKTGEMVEVEMPAAKAADRLEKHMTNLRSLIDCLGGAAA